MNPYLEFVIWWGVTLAVFALFYLSCVITMRC
jgi:hypothetical protein